MAGVAFLAFLLLVTVAAAVLVAWFGHAVLQRVRQERQHGPSRPEAGSGGQPTVEHYAAINDQLNNAGQGLMASGYDYLCRPNDVPMSRSNLLRATNVATLSGGGSGGPNSQNLCTLSALDHNVLKYSSDACESQPMQCCNKSNRFLYNSSFSDTIKRIGVKAGTDNIAKCVIELNDDMPEHRLRSYDRFLYDSGIWLSSRMRRLREEIRQKEAHRDSLRQQVRDTINRQNEHIAQHASCSTDLNIAREQHAQARSDLQGARDSCSTELRNNNCG